MDGVFVSDIGFIHHFDSRLVTTLNYSAIADLHTLQISKAYAKPSHPTLTIRFPVTDLNKGDSSASVHLLNILFTNSLITLP
jgi:hypothetical protein